MGKPAVYKSFQWDFLLHIFLKAYLIYGYSDDLKDTDELINAKSLVWL